MATAAQLKTLVKSHFEDNNEKFNTVALQIAAHEAKLGHTNLANDIRKIIDTSKINKPKLKNIDSNLQGLFLEIFPQERLADLVVAPHIKNRIERIINEFTFRVHIPADTRSAFPVISVQSPVSIQCCWQS